MNKVSLRNPLILKSLDRLASPLACSLARLATFALPAKRIEHRPLIIRPGGMGDLILLCIACESLGIDPRQPLWLIEKRSRIWADHLGLDYLCYDEGLFAANLRISGSFSTVINTEQRFGLAQASALLARARSGKLYCFATNRRSKWAGVRVAYDPDQSHETVEFARLIAVALDLPVTPNVVRHRRNRPAIPGQRVVGLAGLQSAQRTLTVESWESLIRDWTGDRPFVLAGSAADSDFAQRLSLRFPARSNWFQGTFSELCDLIAGAEEVLTMDGGFLHMATYYGVPVQAVFTSSRDRKWAPLAPGSAIIRRRDLACQPCAWFAQVPSCRHNFACKDIKYQQHLTVIS